MGKRRLAVVSASTAALLLPACYAPVRHRVLTFFFDGVPPLWSPPEAQDGQATAAPGKAAERASDAGTAVQMVYPHPPYVNNRCDACHSPQTGQLFRTPQEGLCQTCHSDVPGRARYVHGPVAVGDCLFCHHFHTSMHPKLLLEDARATCLRCHELEDLGEGSHHDGITHESCVRCHNSHGGADRFFLKQDGP